MSLLWVIFLLVRKNFDSIKWISLQMADENPNVLSARIKELEELLVESSEQYERYIKTLQKRVRVLKEERDSAHNMARSNLIKLEVVKSL